MGKLKSTSSSMALSLGRLSWDNRKRCLFHCGQTSFLSTKNKNINEQFYQNVFGSTGS
ncbi:MAG TPA: hypothetical protein PK048_04640 [Candidatus Absconditabacterales bacterium]|nr:hypothetical protein [Candidatus Absconditabacterales bacterium]